MQNYNFKPLVSIPKTLNSWGKILLFRCLEYLKIAVIIALSVVVQHKTVFIDKDWNQHSFCQMQQANYYLLSVGYLILNWQHPPLFHNK